MGIKVAVVSTWFPHQNNPGEGAFVLQEVKNLQAHGVDIRVIHLCSPQRVSESGSSIYEGVRVIRVPMSTSSPVSILRVSSQLSILLRTADVVHTHAFSSILPFVFHRPRQPWVHTEHWSGLTTAQDYMATWKRKCLRMLLHLEVLPDVSVGVVRFLADPLRKYRGGKDTRVIPVVVPSPEQLTPYPQGDTLELVSVGGLVPGKNPILAAETVGLLYQGGHNVHLTWVGDGPLRQDMEDLIHDLELPVTLAGQVSPAEVSQYIEKAHMFFGPTRGDNFFTSAAESIVRGRPVVAGSNGGHVEYLSPQVSQLVEDLTPKGCAEAILELRERTLKLSPDKVAETVGSKFSADTVADSYIRLYKELLNAF